VLWYVHSSLAQAFSERVTGRNEFRLTRSHVLGPELDYHVEELGAALRFDRT
jgi:hypothetical protein